MSMTGLPPAVEEYLATNQPELMARAETLVG